MSLPRSETVVVIGAGVIGLTAALCIQEHILQQRLPYQVLLAAREFPSGLLSGPSINYASMWAGAHIRPIPADTPQLRREAAWLKKTCKTFGQIAEKEPWVGITPLQGIEYLANPPKGYVDLFSDEATFYEANGLSGFRKIEENELPAGMRMGFEYDTFCINSPLYCLSLLQKFLTGGGKTMKKSLVNEWEAFDLVENVKLVINASGMGFNDPNSFPIRGQTCLVSNPCNKTITQQNADGTWTFIIPRGFGGGTVVGGTKEFNDWSSQASMETRDRLLHNASQMHPEFLGAEGNLQLITDIVGRRPARHGGMRIELEKRDDNSGRAQTVLHAYGAGGRGYEISWGVGEEVAMLFDSFTRRKQSKL